MTERREAIKDARQARRDEWKMRDPTELEANLALTTCVSRIDHCSLCDGYGAIFGRSGEEQRDTWQQWYTENFSSELPHVIENLGSPNIWEHWDPPPPAGIPCVIGITVPPNLFEWEINAINACADVQAVVMAGDEQRAKLKESAQKLNEKRSS